MEERLQRRKRLGLLLLPAATALVVVGVLLVDEARLVGLLGLVALAQGIGFGVAALTFAIFRHNPLSRERVNGGS